jgi:subtilisin family serine protease
MSLSSPGRRLPAAAAAAALLAAGLAAAAPAAADPTHDPADSGPDAANPGTPAATVSHTVTLITGDVVTLTTLADGQQVAEVQRPDEASGGVRIHQSSCEPADRSHCSDDLYVLPDEALPLVSAGRLDRNLFNVTDLIEMGYDDAHVDALPVIATYRPAQARLASPPPPEGSSITRRLDSIGGAALDADKAQVRTFWNSVAGAHAPSEARTFAGDGGVDRLWLDGRVEPMLDESVPQVGAPDAWAAGYDGDGVTVAVLDTGVDTTHPDLADRIVETVSFVPGEQIDDVNGHGTHVASTVAGNGAASDGVYRGVAPAAAGRESSEEMTCPPVRFPSAPTSASYAARPRSCAMPHEQATRPRSTASPRLLRARSHAGSPPPSSWLRASSDSLAGPSCGPR